MSNVFRLSLAGFLCALFLFAGADFDAPKKVNVVTGGGYFPVLIQLKSGELMAVLRGGAPHIGVKGRLDVVTSDDEGRTWSRPWTVVEGPDDHRNPAFGQLQNGDLILAYVILHGYDSTGLNLSGSPSEHDAEGVYVVRSRDNGKTWSQPKRSESIHALQKDGGSVSPYAKLVQLADGTVLMSVYYQFSGARGHEDYVFRSRDNGDTWGEPVLVGKHYNETGLLALSGQRLLAAMRSETGGHLATASSNDGGKTWSEPKQITRDREHPGDLIALKNGDVLLSYGERNKPFGVEAVLSHDGGQTWNFDTKTILADDAASTDCGYPSSIQLAHGKIVTIYYQVDDARNTPDTAHAKSVIWTVRSR